LKIYNLYKRPLLTIVSIIDSDNMNPYLNKVLSCKFFSKRTHWHRGDGWNHNWIG